MMLSAFPTPYAPFTSPLGGEVDPSGSGEGAFSWCGAGERPPHPAPCADLSPQGEVKRATP